jgi:hypothetical protein
MKRALQIFTLFILGCFCFACGPEKSATISPGNETPAPTVEPKKKTFDDDLATVRYSDYTYIFVLRRRDGKAFDGDDSKFIRANSPPETNQRMISDEGKAVILGTNFRFYPGQWDALSGRFDLQDLSAIKYEKNENDAPPKPTPKGKAQQ